MVKSAAKREAVAHLQFVMDLAERRACFSVGADRKMVRYPTNGPGIVPLEAYNWKVARWSSRTSNPDSRSTRTVVGSR